MADVKFNDFLLQYFMQLRFNNMPPEVRAQFDSYAKNNDFRGHMKYWKSNLAHTDSEGNLVANDLPDPNGADFHLTDEEWKKFFKEFQNAFRKMATKRKDFEGAINFDTQNNPPLEFLDEYFGPDRLFSQAVATAAAETQINNLLQILENNTSAAQGYLSIQNLISYEDLVDGIKSKKYNTDPEFQSKLQTAAQYMAYHQQSGDLGFDLTNCDCRTIIEGFEEQDIEPEKLEAFKTEYDILLRRLASKDKIRNAFPADKLINAYNTAKSNVAYDDESSKDYVPPKREDELNFMQQISKEVSDTYADTLEKYFKLRGNENYFSPQAKQIVDGIHKEKIKPTDGLKAVLDNASNIEKKLKYKSPQATEHFSWFIKTMNELQNTMPKAFEGALSNGRKMRAIVEELIMIAVRDGKEKEAKTAMEVLSVIKYGYTTSKIMDALKKEDLTLFSDSKLSWNKNSGMQFITKALDKGIKTAFTGIGYGVTMIGNAFWLSGSKFDGRLGRMSDSQQRWVNQNNHTLAQHIQANTKLDALAQNKIAQARTNQQNANQGQTGNNIITDANYNQHKQNLDNARTAEQAEKNRLDQLKTTLNYDTAKTNVDNHQTYTNQKNDLEQKIIDLTDEIQNLDRQIQLISATPGMTPEEKQVRIKALVQNKIQKDDELKNANTELTNIDNAIQQIEQDPNWQNNTYQNTVQNIDQQENAYRDQLRANNALDDRLSKWQSATETITELQNQINARQEEIQNWDKDHQDLYRKLMAHWDLLETGRNTHTGVMYNWTTLSAKQSQKNFDAKKQSIIDDYLNNYTYRA
ncbi:MAG: hypothetical protein UIH99_04590 [Alphaproteobacteria bacterium]|nr:hypothetical protein [Alphaproteobacteria bacterium]